MGKERLASVGASHPPIVGAWAEFGLNLMAAMFACRSRRLKDERVALAAARPALGRSLTRLDRQARI
jgi:hypothetical protein